MVRPGRDQLAGPGSSPRLRGEYIIDVKDFRNDNKRETLAQMNPMAKLIHPEDVAQLCVFLASPAARSVTGAAYMMDGGESV